MKTIQVGDVFPTNEGGSVTVTSISGGSLGVGIKHNDAFGYETTVPLNQLNSGLIKNPFRPTVYGVGYFGVGPYLARYSGRDTKEYATWYNMLSRVYDSRVQVKKPFYVGCIVDARWHNFQVFADWYSNNPFNYPDYQIDKDILIRGNKVYSPETCCLVPNVINTQFRDMSSYIVDNGLPVGVYPAANGKRYRAIHGPVKLGTHDTMEQAHEVYLNYRREYLYELARRYLNTVDIRVIYTLLETANNL